MWDEACAGKVKHSPFLMGTGASVKLHMQDHLAGMFTFFMEDRTGPIRSQVKPRCVVYDFDSAPHLLSTQRHRHT